MKKIFSLLSIATLGLGLMTITSCSKTESVDGKVKTFNDGSNTYTYDYDNQNRIINAVSSGGTTTIYSYGSNSVTQTTGTNIKTYTLNSQGYVSADGNVIFTYNSDGQQISNTYSSVGYTSTTTNTYANGDLTSAVTNTTYGGVTNSTTTTYTYLDKTEYRQSGLNIFGKRSQHLIDKITQTSGTTTVVATYAYNFDNKGRVIQEIYTQTGNNHNYTYTYVNN